MELSTGRKVLYPLLTYCYLGLENSILSLFRQAHMYELLVNSATKYRPSSVLTDVHNGNIWAEFQTFNGKPFLSDPLCLALCMNVDWFQPHKHVTYSFGIIYLPIMNLPREERYKRENILLIGILPGPQETSRSINSYLNPLVKELTKFLEGVTISVHTHDGTAKKLVKCALLCVSCDIPAGRKVCGFLGHGARYGCCRCGKCFEGCVGQMDYSGFERDSWPPRSGSEHRQVCQRLLNCSTKKDQHEEIESSTGYRYSVLLQLPYFDSTRMLVVDGMHNLFLGTAKHVLKAIWLEKQIIDYGKLSLIQERVDNYKIPSDIGRIPYKISTSFSAFTTDQFKNWVVYFSLIVLRGILTGEHLECWRHFVLACRLLLQCEITLEQLVLADALLMKFCRRTECMYGPSIIRPNMHLHAHLRQCIADYGPLHEFWAFPFERYNGLLGDLPNNKRSIEVQMMNRFIQDNSYMLQSMPDTFLELKQHIPTYTKEAGSLETLSTPSNDTLAQSYPKGFHVATCM